MRTPIRNTWNIHENQPDPGDGAAFAEDRSRLNGGPAGAAAAAVAAGLAAA